MRVLTLTPWFPAFPGDNSGSFVWESVNAVHGLGHEVKVMVAQPWRPRWARWFSRDWSRDRLDVSKFPDRFRLQQVQHYSVPRNYFRSLGNRHFMRRMLPLLIRAADSFEPDVIHAHTELPGCAAVQAAKQLGIGSVVTVHGVNHHPRLNTAKQIDFYRTWLGAADRIVLVGHPLSEYFSHVIGRDDHFCIVPNGFDLGDDQSKAQKAGKAWGSPLRLVSLSNLHEGKGIEITLQALRGLLDHGLTDWTYKVVGDGALRNELERLTVELKLTDRVTFVGACRHHQVAQHLSEGDVFVLPSYREAFGVAYLEAMSVGLLAIAVEGQGPDTFIQHQETGLLVQPRSVESLVDGLMQVMNQQEKMQLIAAQGQQHVCQNYSLRRHGQRLVDVYQQVSGEDR